MDRGQYLIIPHLFDGTNYVYWKVCMRAFLQSLEEKVWQVVEIGWTKPKEAPADWDEAKIKAANFNSRALKPMQQKFTSNLSPPRYNSPTVRCATWTNST